MTDIVEWLRNSTSAEWNGPMLNKAADEIERLETEIQKLREEPHYEREEAEEEPRHNPDAFHIDGW